MKSVAHNRGIIAPALLLIALSATAGFAQGSRKDEAGGQEPTVNILPDPAAQRREMITSLKAMERHLATMEKTMAGLERIAGAQLRLQFDQQKEKTEVKAKENSK
ncbi:MAG: hypothetical protein O3A95_06165 [Planctomycetota bacterium]|nr:hypothetical protein [Planctomycetota bacterium]MDA1113867.1 hypothetical protein [Planctomycetota bacterium]